MFYRESFGSGEGEGGVDDMTDAIGAGACICSALMGSFTRAHSKCFDGDRAFRGVNRGENPLNSYVLGELLEFPYQIHVAFRNVRDAGSGASSSLNNEGLSNSHRLTIKAHLSTDVNLACVRK